MEPIFTYGDISITLVELIAGFALILVSVLITLYLSRRAARMWGQHLNQVHRQQAEMQGRLAQMSEEAAQREVLEEAGIKTKNPRYVFSQPWPFPSQLMMGLILEAENTDITIDPKELEDARWFTRDEVLAVLENRGDAFNCPPRQTIAHQLLRHWLSETTG